MPITFGVGAFACSCVPVGVGVVAIYGSVLPTCGSFLAGLLGAVGDLVAVRRSIVAK